MQTLFSLCILFVFLSAQHTHTTYASLSSILATTTTTTHITKNGKLFLFFFLSFDFFPIKKKAGFCSFYLFMMIFFSGFNSDDIFHVFFVSFCLPFLLQVFFAQLVLWKFFISIFYLLCAPPFYFLIYSLTYELCLPSKLLLFTKLKMTFRSSHKIKDIHKDQY